MIHFEVVKLLSFKLKVGWVEDTEPRPGVELEMKKKEIQCNKS